MVKNLDKIIHSVKRQMECLYKLNNEFVYTDLKPANIGILYKTNKNGHNSIDKIKLIDLGSVFMDEDKQYVGTFPCTYHKDGYFKLKTEKNKLQCMHMSLIVLIFFLLKILSMKANRLFLN